MLHILSLTMYKWFASLQTLEFLRKYASVWLQSKQFCDCGTDYFDGVGFCDDLPKRLSVNIRNGAAKYLTFLLTREVVFALGSSLTRILFENLYAS